MCLGLDLTVQKATWSMRSLLHPSEDRALLGQDHPDAVVKELVYTCQKDCFANSAQGSYLPCLLIRCAGLRTHHAM